MQFFLSFSLSLGFLGLIKILSGGSWTELEDDGPWRVANKHTNTSPQETEKEEEEGKKTFFSKDFLPTGAA